MLSLLSSGTKSISEGIDNNIPGAKGFRKAKKFVKLKSHGAREQTRKQRVEERAEEYRKQDEHYNSPEFVGPKKETPTPTPNNPLPVSDKPVYTDESGEKGKHAPESAEVVKRLDLVFGNVSLLCFEMLK